MALADASPDPPASLDGLDTLYPLACMLVGPEGAPALLGRVYERVAKAPPPDRPDTLDDWLRTLLREASASSTQSVPPNASRTAQSPGSDSLRQEAAERLLQRTVPVALATCSPLERFFISLSAVGAAESVRAAHLEENVEGALPADPLALLREKLHDVLSEPESDVLDETLSDADLREAVRNLLHDRFAPVPSSLRAKLRSILQAPEPEEAAPTPESSDAASEGLLERLPSRPRPQALLFVLLLGALVVGGGLAVSYLGDSSSPPSGTTTPPDLVAFSADQAGAVSVTRSTSRRSAAETYLDSLWGRRVRLPAVDGAQIEGVGRLRTVNDTEVPVVVYADTEDGARITTFVYNYALVDRLDGAARLGTRLREELGQSNHLISTEQASPAGLLWRDRSTIFVVVAPALSTDSLRARVRP